MNKFSTQNIHLAGNGKTCTMSQFQVLEVIFNSEEPISKSKITSKIDLHPSSTEAGINDCIKKGHIQKTEKGYETVDEFNREKLERIRPKTISELTDDG